jgi:hypothetical protein
LAFFEGHDFAACEKNNILYQGTTSQLAEKRSVLKGHGLSRAANG